MTLDQQTIVISLRSEEPIRNRFDHVKLTHVHIKRLFDLFRQVRFEMDALKYFEKKTRLLALLEPMHALLDEIHAFNAENEDD